MFITFFLSFHIHVASLTLYRIRNQVYLSTRNRSRLNAILEGFLKTTQNLIANLRAHPHLYADSSCSPVFIKVQLASWATIVKLGVGIPTLYLWSPVGEQMYFSLVPSEGPIMPINDEWFEPFPWAGTNGMVPQQIRNAYIIRIQGCSALVRQAPRGWGGCAN